MQARQIELDTSGNLILPDGLLGSVQLVPHAEIITTINGKRAFAPVTVDKSDAVKIEAAIKEVAGEVMVDISKDKLLAYIQLKPTKKITPKLGLKNNLQGMLVEIYPQTKLEYQFDLSMILSTLAQKGITYGIDQQAIKTLLQNPSDDRVLIARGVKPKPGVDESITILFDTKKDDRPKVLADGRVDFKQKKIASVDIGEVLAVKVAGKPGEPGMAVDGSKIEPPAYKTLELKAGQGTMLQQDGFSVVALDSGLPSVAIKKDVWTFQVLPLLEYSDVNLSTGNIEFNGNLRINKDVAEGMSVFSSADVEVGGSVYEAKVIALGNLTIHKNVISSFISVGGMLEFQDDLKTKLQIVNKSLIELYQLLVVLKQRSNELGKQFPTGQMIAALIGKKFGDLPKIVDELYTLSKQNAVISANIKDLISELIVKFRRLGWHKAKGIEEVQIMQQRVATALTYLDALGESKGDVVVSYALNSTIESAGDVRVVGKGCINTIIKAKGNVIIDSIFRGGAITCQGTVKIKEVGSEIGAKTSIKTSGKVIQIEKAYSNVLLAAGSNTRTLNSTEYKIYMKED
ncbi:FapA family protein [Peptococcaceae bacterium 1198_IL3148]